MTNSFIRHTRPIEGRESDAIISVPQGERENMTLDEFESWMTYRLPLWDHAKYVLSLIEAVRAADKALAEAGDISDCEKCKCHICLATIEYRHARVKLGGGDDKAE